MAMFFSLKEIGNAVPVPGHIYGDRIEGLFGEKWIWEEVKKQVWQGRKEIA